jgi:predicted DNA binding protein
MGLIAEFTTPTSTFPVGRAVDGDLRVELERIVPTDDSVVPFFWTWGDDLGGFERELRGEPAIEVEGPIARTDHGALYRAEWTGETSRTVRELFDFEFTLLSGTCDADQWTFRVRFEEPDVASAFQRFLGEHDVPHELTRVQGIADLTPRSRAGLTEKQRETLLTAYDEGFFAVPRRITIRELADRLDVAPSSTSDRLRRGVGRLVEGTLIADRDLLRAATPSPDRPPK